MLSLKWPKLRMVVHTCSTSNSGSKGRGFQIHGQAGKSYQDPISKTKPKQKGWGCN
jgi:hypothetical protein